MIEVRHLRYRYPEEPLPALEGVDLRIAEGDFVLVAGPTSSGKSTLLRAMVGLVPHFFGGELHGEVCVEGRNTRTHHPRDLADVVGFVAQDPGATTVCEQVEDEIVFTMENLGVPRTAMRTRLEEVLDALGIADLRNRRLDTLSGGERQRVAIASVLAAHPRFLVLDEPTSQLDPQSAEDVLAVLQRLNADLGIAVVLVEHRLERVVQYVDRMVVLEDGRICHDGEPRTVLELSRPATPLTRVARALGWRPLPLSVREGRAFAAGVAVTSPRRDREPAPLGEVLAEAKKVSVSRGGRDVLRGVGLEVRAGETVALVGRNGAGKTTLLRTLVGLVRPYAGICRIAGLDPARVGVESIGKRVAYVPQSADALLFQETAAAEIAFTLRARQAPGSPFEVLAGARLADVARADPRDLSAGRRLRLAVVAASAGDPPVVLLDEPTRGMDEESKEWLAEQLRAWRRRGAAAVLVTHDVELIARAATRVVLLAGGEVVLDGSVHEALTGSLFGSQMSKVFRNPKILTAEDALEAVGAS